MIKKILVIFLCVSILSLTIYFGLKDKQKIRQDKLRGEEAEFAYAIATGNRISELEIDIKMTELNMTMDIIRDLVNRIDDLEADLATLEGEVNALRLKIE